jgi:hypothetical protein
MSATVKDAVTAVNLMTTPPVTITAGNPSAAPPALCTTPG